LPGAENSRRSCALFPFRKEFFRVPIETVRDEVKKINPDAEFKITALADNYRKSEAIRAKLHEDKEKRSWGSFPDAI
jgi:hypothetical protein